MKIIAIVKRILPALLPMLFSASINAADDWAQFQRFEKENERYRTENPEAKPKAVFMGSSIIEGWIGLHPEFFSSNNLLSRGISGHTTYQMLLRFRDDVINLQPDYVVIYGGTNDIAENNHAYNETRTLGNIISMAELAEANGIKVVLSSVLPAEEYYWNKGITEVPEKIVSINKRIREYAESKGYPYIDYYTLLTDEKGALPGVYSKDGVHPNSDAYFLMEKAVITDAPALVNQP